MPILSEAMRDRLDGLANPLLVKEMYQSLHNKKFLSALWLLLGAALFAYVLVYSGAEGRDCGDDMFGVFATLMYYVGVLVLPALAFLNLHEEVKSRTIELVHITRMSARRHVRGRLLASAVKIGLLFSTVGPFAAAAYLFKGIAILPILIILWTVLALALFGCALGIYFAALTSVREIRSLAWLGFLGVLFWAFIIPLGGISTLQFARELGWSGSADFAEVLVILGALTGLLLCVMWFISAGATNLLTFEADRCSDRTKRSFLYVLLGLGGMFLLPAAFENPVDSYAAPALASLAAVPLAVFALFWLTDRERVPRRIQRKLESRGRGRALLSFPFVDGPGSSALYLVLALALITLLIGMILSVDPDPDSAALRAAALPLILWVGYALFFAAVTRGVVRLLPKRRRTLKVTRGVLLGLIALNLIVPLAWSAAQAWTGRFEPSMFTGLFPLQHVICMAETHSYSLLQLFVDTAIPLAVGFGVHLGLILEHLRRYLDGQSGKRHRAGRGG